MVPQPEKPRHQQRRGDQPADRHDGGGLADDNHAFVVSSGADEEFEIPDLVNGPPYADKIVDLSVLSPYGITAHDWEEGAAPSLVDLVPLEDPAPAVMSVYVTLRVVDNLKTIPAPILPHTAQKLHDYLGYDGQLFGTQHVVEYHEETRSHQTLTYDHSGFHRHLGEE